MIVLQTNGLIPIVAFTTFGINVKPNSENPIGYFGTGLKYAVAVILRIGGKFKLFVDGVEYEFFIKKTDFRGKEFDMIRMKKRKGILSSWQYDSLPFTTELGKNWEPWMALRELESNTRDENGHSYSTEEMPIITNGKTQIIIDCPEIEEAYENIDHIFMPEKKLLHEIGHVQIFEGESDYVFFRGLRVTDLSKQSKFTYNFTTGFKLTEDRTSANVYLDNHAIMEAIMRLEEQDFVDDIMDLKQDLWFESSLPYDQPYVVPSMTYTRSLAHRMTTGGYVAPRMKTYYRATQVESSMETLIDVSLTAEVWIELLAVYDLPREVRESIEERLDNEEIPYK